MKKALLIIAAAALLLVPVAVYAAVSYSPVGAGVRGYYGAGINGTDSNLTEQQEADLEESFQDMIALRKETIQKQVQDGLLTEQEGQLALERLDEMADYHEEYGYRSAAYGCGWNGYYDDLDTLRGGYGRGMMRYYDGRLDWDE
jgi:hypothetical protein